MENIQRQLPPPISATTVLRRLQAPGVVAITDHIPAFLEPPCQAAGGARSLLTIGGLSQYLSVPVGTLYQWVSRKQIPYVKVGRLTRFDARVIDAWLGKNSHKPFEMPSRGDPAWGLDRVARRF